jgi:DNA-binding HxlR family transcriptional regulator
VPGGVDEQRPPSVRALPRADRTWTPLARALAATGDRWTLTIAHALAPGRTRLTHLQKRLPGISTGVLERHIQRMVNFDLVSRTRFREVPPRVELELTDAGRALLPVAGALARWGMHHRWSAPGEGERIDLGAILRMLPALLEGNTGLPDGSVEVAVTDTDPAVRWVYLVRDGQLLAAGGSQNAAERPPQGARPTALIDGDERAWVAALGPAGDGTRLRLGGDERFARRFLDALRR